MADPRAESKPGPNAVLPLAREGYRKTDLNLRDLAEVAAFPGFWISLRNLTRDVRAFGRGLICWKIFRCDRRAAMFHHVTFRVFFFVLSLIGISRANWIELKDGTRMEGEIISVTTESVVIEVQATPTIREQQSVPRADVVKIQRATMDDLAFADIQKITVPQTADHPCVMEALLARVQPFLAQYAYSKHIGAARQLAKDLETERDRLQAGEVKIDGQWFAASETSGKQGDLGAQLQLSKMKQAPDPVTALIAYEGLEKEYATSSTYPEAVELARQTLGALRTAISRVRGELAVIERDRAEGLQLASVDRRQVMESAIVQEKAAVDAKIAKAKQSGSKWLPVLPEAKLLDDLTKLAEAEEQRLAKLDVASMKAASAAAVEAKKQIASGQLADAATSLARAEQLWSQHNQLASLRDELKKAESEAAKTVSKTPPNS